MISHPITPFTLDAADGAAIAAYGSLPSSLAEAIVQIAHGIGRALRPLRPPDLAAHPISSRSGRRLDYRSAPGVQ